MKQVSSTSKEVASNAVKLHEMVADFKTWFYQPGAATSPCPGLIISGSGEGL
jgi:hypothetical protein